MLVSKALDEEAAHKPTTIRVNGLGHVHSGALELTFDRLEATRIAFIPWSGSFGILVTNMGGKRLVKAHSFPADRLKPRASSTHLINAHDWMTCRGNTYGMHFDDAKQAVIYKVKTFFEAQGLTCCNCVHLKRSYLKQAYGSRFASFLQRTQSAPNKKGRPLGPPFSYRRLLKLSANRIR